MAALTGGDPMQDSPSAEELIAAVQAHLQEKVLPALEEPGLRFRTLVAANVLGIVAREQALAPELARAEWDRLRGLLSWEAPRPEALAALTAVIATMNEALCEAIDAGAFDEPAPRRALLAHCRQTAMEKLVIANPRFLERVEAGR
jgi:hypothetical protein